MLLRFSDISAKTLFLNRLADAAPELSTRARASVSQPTVVTIVDPNPIQEAVIQSLAQADSDVKVFADVQFKTASGL